MFPIRGLKLQEKKEKREKINTLKKMGMNDLKARTCRLESFRIRYGIAFKNICEKARLPQLVFSKIVLKYFHLQTDIFYDIF